MSDRRERRPKGYVAAQQFEFGIDGGFALIRDSAIDWQRIADEKAAEERAAKHADELQTKLFE